MITKYLTNTSCPGTSKSPFSLKGGFRGIAGHLTRIPRAPLFTEAGNLGLPLFIDRRNGYLLYLMIVFAALFLFGCGSKKEKPLPPPSIKVQAVTVETGAITQVLNLSGNLRFISNTTVSSEVAAQIKSIDVRDGQPLRKGQTLLRFDDSIIKAAADQARGNLQKDEATLAFMKTDWEKNVPLLDSGAISRTTYDQKYSNYQNSVGQVEADKGALAKAEEDLKHCVVVSPINGLLSSRFVEPGDWGSVGGKLFQVSDYTTVYVGVFLSDKDVGKLNFDKVIQEGKGTEAEVTIDSFPEKVFTGYVGYIQPVTNINRLFEVRIYIDNRDMKLLEGMYARAKIVVKRIPDVTRIPITALLEQIRANESNSVVRVDKGGKAEITRIKIGPTDRNFAQVVEGLTPGDVVVIEGKEVLNSGQPLDITLIRD
jgi:RND family efflux transporter MFP subunit